MTIGYSNTRYSEKFYYYTTDEVIGRSIEHYGEYSQIEVDYLLSILNQNCVVYDIGGNIGYHATAFATASKYVYSFEPNQNNFELLRKNTAHLDNVFAMNVAVSNHNGIVRMLDFDPSVPANYGTVRIGEGEGSALSIRLDDFNLAKPDFIKIDVEGAEYEVLQGLSNTIDRFRPVIYLEAHETKEFSSIYELLKKFNYNMYWCEVKNYNPNNFRQNTVNIFGEYVLFSVLAFPEFYPELPLDMVIGPDDSPDKVSARVWARDKL